MIDYVTKMIFCSAVLFGLYKILLQNEKGCQFNRVYLLGGVAFPFLLPLIRIPAAISVTRMGESLSIMESTNLTSPGTGGEVHDSISYGSLALIAYGVVSFVVLFRFLHNLYRMRALIKSAPHQYRNGITWVLTHKPIAPHSFLNFIILNRGQYERGEIEREILLHEKTHVQQRHSLDILLTELAIAVSWFNPVLYGFRESIRLNHEYLADEEVVRALGEPVAYQQLLLSRARHPEHHSLTSAFNFLQTKKRIIMINKTTSKASMIARAIFLAPLVALVCFLSLKKSEAQSTIQDLKNSAGSQQLPSTQEITKEYSSVLEHYGGQGTKEWKSRLFHSLSKEDLNKLQTLFNRMTPEQQNQQTVIFLHIPQLPGVVPTAEQMEKYKDAATYGVWIDGKRISNSTLEQFQNTDFSQVNESELMKNAAHYGKYKYQVDLMTTSYYQDYVNKSRGDQTLAIRGKQR